MGKWFSIDCVFLDEKGRIKTSLLDDGYLLYSDLLINQVNSLGGRESFKSDLENVHNFLTETDEEIQIFPSSYENINFICCKLVVDNKLMGSVVGYPFVFNNKADSLHSSIRSLLREWKVDDVKSQKP